MRLQWDESLSDLSEIFKQVGENTWLLYSHTHGSLGGLISSRDFIDTITKLKIENDDGTFSYRGFGQSVDCEEKPEGLNGAVRGWNYTSGSSYRPTHERYDEEDAKEWLDSRNDTHGTELTYIFCCDLKVFFFFFFFFFSFKSQMANTPQAGGSQMANTPQAGATKKKHKKKNLFFRDGCLRV